MFTHFIFISNYTYGPETFRIGATTYLFDPFSTADPAVARRMPPLHAHVARSQNFGVMFKQTHLLIDLIQKIP